MYCCHVSWNEPERIQFSHVSVDGAVVGVRTKINTFTLASHISCLETGEKWNSVCLLTNEKVEREPLTTSRTFSPVASHSPGTLHMHSGGPATEVINKAFLLSKYLSKGNDTSRKEPIKGLFLT